MENDLNSRNRVFATRAILINFFFELLTLVIMASKLNKISNQYILFIPNAKYFGKSKSKENARSFKGFNIQLIYIKNERRITR